MSLFWRGAKRAADLDAFHIPPNSARWSPDVVGERSLRVSAMWAARRLRADLISTLPVDVYRQIEGRAVEVPKPAFFRRPSSMFSWQEWLYATQSDLDAYGNTFGLIVAYDGGGRPAQIELTPAAEWTVRVTAAGAVEYRRKGVLVPNAEVWHERQYVVSGLPVGLSPVAYAALSVAHNLSAQEFAVQWFTSGAQPSGVLRNRERTMTPDAAAVMKDRFRAATQRREVFVTGSDWEYSPAAGAASDAKFLDAISATAVDIARYMSVPADIIDAAVSGESITYANITERNLQLLTLNLGPAITRRELTFSERLTASPRFVKFNTDALLRMDARQKTELLAAGIDARIRTPDESRAILDLPPLTDDDYAQFDRLFGKQPPPGTKTGVPA